MSANNTTRSTAERAKPEARTKAKSPVASTEKTAVLTSQKRPETDFTSHRVWPD